MANIPHPQNNRQCPLCKINQPPFLPSGMAPYDNKRAGDGQQQWRRGKLWGREQSRGKQRPEHGTTTPGEEQWWQRRESPITLGQRTPPAHHRHIADFIEAQGLRVQLNEILHAANKRITDLPTIPKCVNNGRPFVCWVHILGQCRFPNCAFKNGHVSHSSIPDAFAEEVVTILTPGVKHCACTREQEGAPGKRQRADPQN
jgi:hypothetical protein